MGTWHVSSFILILYNVFQSDFIVLNLSILNYFTKWISRYLIIFRLLWIKLFSYFLIAAWKSYRHRVDFCTVSYSLWQKYFSSFNGFLWLPWNFLHKQSCVLWIKTILLLPFHLKNIFLASLYCLVQGWETSILWILKGQVISFGLNLPMQLLVGVEIQ